MWSLTFVLFLLRQDQQRGFWKCSGWIPYGEARGLPTGSIWCHAHVLAEQCSLQAIFWFPQHFSPWFWKLTQLSNNSSNLWKYCHYMWNWLHIHGCLSAFNNHTWWQLPEIDKCLLIWQLPFCKRYTWPKAHSTSNHILHPSKAAREGTVCNVYLTTYKNVMNFFHIKTESFSLS